MNRWKKLLLVGFLGTTVFLSIGSPFKLPINWDDSYKDGTLDAGNFSLLADEAHDSVYTATKTIQKIWLTGISKDDSLRCRVVFSKAGAHQCSTLVRGDGAPNAGAEKAINSTLVQGVDLPDGYTAVVIRNLHAVSLTISYVVLYKS